MKGEEIQKMLAPVVAAQGLECLGIEYIPHASNSMLRIYIDRPETGVMLEDCERVSREVSAFLDESDPLAGHYTLEVTSPGLDRPLFVPAHFAQFIGETAKVQLSLPIAGRRRFKGEILAVVGNQITLDQDGTEVVLAHDNIHSARLVPDFEVAKKPTGKKK